jgi:DNA-binding transcriptional LysR family regulator
MDVRQGMNWGAVSFDWNQAKAFLATAESGSLSAAARELGITQPTVGRQIAALEAELGTLLFDRRGRMLTLSQSGLELLEHVRAMSEAANLISLTASGRSQSVEGLVTITASDVFATCRLPEIVKRIRAKAPKIEIEIIASNEVRDLQRREADIAIRHVRPDQPELIARLIRESRAHLCASTAYLAEFGRPDSVEDLADAQFIGFQSAERLLPVLNPFGLCLTRENFSVITNSGVAGLEMVRQGVGIGLFPRELIDSDPDLDLVLPDAVAIPFPFWLTTHRELHTSRRIRLAFDIIAESFR